MSQINSKSEPRIAIIGGGVIGLAIGWRLAARGRAVTLFERDLAGRGASFAAAGMLAAGIEAEPGERALLALNRASQALWPSFARELEAASGVALHLRQEGTLSIALTRDDAARLRFQYDFQRSEGLSPQFLSGAEARAREPHLHPNTAAAILSAEDTQIDNRCLARALKVAFEAAGGTLREHAKVTALEITAGRIRGLIIEETEYFEAPIVVLAAGAWSGEIAGLPSAVRPPVRPVKGQMLAVRMDPRAAPLLTHVIWTPRVYLVPRLDGRLIIGGTVEERGFDPNLTAGGVLALLEGAWRALPGIEDLPIDEMWVGFRPGSRDDAPILGACGIEGLVLATGHYRNGILLTPITARAIAHQILTGDLEEKIRPFALDRFTPASLEPASLEKVR
ncbi:MAG TPA: glycine oxidase ThiO [Stellaceae bacterium]|nr:glycine oxidase ThiO [Stellaceae bacterium]